LICNWSGLENREYGHGDPLHWPRDTLYPQKLALSSPTCGGRLVGIVRLQTKTTEFFSYIYIYIYIHATEASQMPSFIMGYVYIHIRWNLWHRLMHEWTACSQNWLMNLFWKFPFRNSMLNILYVFYLPCKAVFYMWLILPQNPSIAKHTVHKTLYTGTYYRVVNTGSFIFTCRKDERTFLMHTYVLGIHKPISEPTHFNPGDGGSMFLQNTGIHPQNYKVSQPSTPQSQ
jgi:hypothetical protein